MGTELTAIWKINNRVLDNDFNGTNLIHDVQHVIVPVIFSKSITFKQIFLKTREAY
jgi:hypothetical protein